ncbi:response regulator transcription factor [Hoyosella sp. YIM 151337]|uniref:response regulator n=1 Tax=Hoyosella sp. YIM 151337 TaxID=2992742 RepID=UPI0022356674|nr:response regulator transcription factor [Hoyosella sp. YIM 151337]MCW4354448.1 response regulator transcription factor [Hoyosella sp. YIM 151337]
MNPQIKVLLVDDDALVRSGLALLLGADPAIDVVGQSPDGSHALRLISALHPDVVLMDIRMPVMDGLTALERLRRAGPAPAVVVLTTFDTDDHVLRALRLGADGFLLKDTPPRDILDAIRKAAAGQPVLSPTVTRRLVAHVTASEPVTAQEQRQADARQTLNLLTDRERDVALAVAEGKTNSEIGTALHLSIPTVKTYMSRVLAKLQCDNRVQVAIIVHDAGLPEKGE